MRDPDLMQRADRAAITLEQAWERWRAMHGLGAEPLPPVSSYVGYSLEEPWGQPRVVFGLRADEAEMLASLLDGHDCVGSVYSEAAPRHDWRLPANGTAARSARGYSGPLSVPAQAPPPGTDVLPPPPMDEYSVGRQADEDVLAADTLSDDALARDRRTDAAELGQTGNGAALRSPARGRPGQGPRTDRNARRPAEDDGEGEEAVAGWPPADGEDPEADLPAAGLEPGVPQSRPLAPLPEVPDFLARLDDGEPVLPEEPVASPRPAGAVRAGGPGYRGPRYRGFPPRYETNQHPGQQSAVAAAGPADDDDSADADAEPGPVRKSHAAAKLSRSARRRSQGG